MSVVFIAPLQNYRLNSSLDHKTCAAAISSCVELLVEFGVKALLPGYDPWMSVDYHDWADINADLTGMYKNVRLAANVETATESTGSCDSREKLLPQRNRPAAALY